MTRYFYDSEFFEDGETIKLISMAFVCEDGRELYLINAEQDLSLFAEDSETAEWLRKNVVPTLPVKYTGHVSHPFEWDTAHPDYETHVFSRAAMRAQILLFMRARSGMPELWANYSVYDMICLNQLWGRMIDKDPILPWYCNDLQQLLRSYVVNPTSLPQMKGTPHHPLDDARHLKKCHEYATSVIRNRRSMVGGYAPYEARNSLPGTA